MKKNLYQLFSTTRQVLLALVLTALSATAYSQATYSLYYTGAAQTLTLQPGTFSIQCWGGDGYTQTAGYNGRGGYSSGILNLTSTTVVYIYVGGVGGYPSTGVTANTWSFNGGGIGYPASNSLYGNGGGASDVRTVGGLWDNSLSLASRVIVAGGGGAGRNSSYIGGNGGGLTGGTGTYFSPDQTGGPTGGTQTAGGSNTGYTSGLTLATLGKAATWDGNTLTANFLAGGGGGYYGGASGRVAGGGGSSYLGGVTSGTTIMYGQTGYVTNPVTNGDGMVILKELCSINLTNASTTGPGPICSGNSATITTNAISNYVWSNGSTSSSIVVSPTVTTSYTLTATSPSNCTSTSVITITVQSGNPNVTAATSATAVCAGQPVILTGGGANTYTWSSGVTNAVSYTPAATGSYTVTGQNACGTGTAAVAVTVNTSPSVFAGVNTPTVCSGSSVTFTSGGSATSYVWTAGVVSGTPYFPGITSNYTLTGTAAGCSSIAVVGVTVIASPNAPPAVTPTAICVGATATLSSTGATGYTWTPGNNVFTSTVAVSPPGPTTYTIVRQNGACTTTATVGLVVNPLPLVNASASPPQICAGTGINFVVVGPITNTWMPGGFTQSNFTLFPNNSTCYTVTGSNGNCTASAVVCITVNTSPVISISSSTNIICQGASVNFTANGNASAFNWLPMNTGNINTSFTPPTTTIVSLTATNTAGCTSTVTQLIQVNPLANLTLTTSLPFVCAGQSALVSVLNPSPNIVYNWNTGPTGPSISVSPTITTNYGIVGTNTVSGCVNTNSIALAVYISTFSIASPSAICKGETATLTAAGSPTSYAWNFPGSPAAPVVTVNPIVNTTYIATGTNGSCSNTVAVTLTVNPLPNVTATVAKSQICKFEIATITANGASTYSWNTGATTQVLTFTLGITTTYTLTGTDDKNCSKTTTVTQFVATCIGIEDVGSNANIGLNVYPNPNNGNFIISSDAGINLNIINSVGQVISTISLSEENKKEISVSSLAPGIYFISGEYNGAKVNKKIVVQR